MKVFFIVNPAAGQGKNMESLISSIETGAKTVGADFEIYTTEFVGDATEYVRYHCENGGPARFIACGGDGTLNEVINGVAGVGNAEVGVIPSGTGNDFCRNFSKVYDFSDVACQIKGVTTKCDAIRYETSFCGEKKQGYCVNMFNIGFDANVAHTTSEMKKKPFLAGSLAYFASILMNLVKKECTKLDIFLDGVKVHGGKLLLTSIANGSYCGGGIKSNPRSSVNDGFANINIINNLSRTRFLSLLPYYMKGSVFELKNVDRYISNHKCKSVLIVPHNGYIKLCVDGEIIDAGETRFEVIHDAFNFVLPSLKKSNLVSDCSEDVCVN